VGFEARLSQLVHQVDGAVACAVLGVDGIPVAQHVAGSPEGLDLESSAVEWGAVLGQAQAAAARLGGGPLEELSLQVGGLWVLLRPVGGGHHLLLVGRMPGNPGKGRFLLRLHAGEVAAGLALLS